MQLLDNLQALWYAMYDKLLLKGKTEVTIVPYVRKIPQQMRRYTNKINNETSQVF